MQKQKNLIYQGLVVLLNHSALECDLFTVNKYFLLWYLSRDSPPQDLKQGELTFLSPAGRETEEGEGHRHTEKTRNEDNGEGGGMGEMEKKR